MIVLCVGQHSVLQREGLSGVVLDVPLTYRILGDVRSGVRGVVEVSKEWLERKHVGPGVYLVSATDGRNVVRFFGEYRPDSSDVSWWYRRIPRAFVTIFEDKSRVWLTLQRFDVSGFVELVREGILRRFGNLGGFRVVGDSVVFEVSGKELSFPIVKFGYQVQMRSTGAFVVFSNSGLEADSLKILYTGYGEPRLSVRPRGDQYRLVDAISYDYDNGVLRVQYRHATPHAPLRESVIDLKGQSIEPSVELSIQKARAIGSLVQEYYLASSSRERNRMGAIGTHFVVDRLNELDYTIVRADTERGNMGGPDVVAVNPEGSYVIVEVKSTSVVGRLEEALGHAEGDIRTKYFDPESGFVWKERRTHHYAPEAIAVAIYPEAEENTVLFFAKALRFEISEGGKKIVEKEFRL